MHGGGHDSPGSDGAGRSSEKSTLTFQTARGTDYGRLIAQNIERLGQATESREVREMTQRIAAEKAAVIEARQKETEQRRLARLAKSAEESAQLNVTRESLRRQKPTAGSQPATKRASSGGATGGTKRQKVAMVVPRLLSGPSGLVSFFGLALVEVLDKGDCLFLAVLAAALLIDSFEASRPYDSSTVAELVNRLRMHACELAQRLFEQNKADPLWDYVKLGLEIRLARDPTAEDLAQLRAQITSELIELQRPGTWNRPSLEFVTWALADFLKREIVVLTVLDNDGLGDNYRLYGCREGCHVRQMDELKTALDSVDDAPLVIVLQGGVSLLRAGPKGELWDRHAAAVAPALGIRPPQQLSQRGQCGQKARDNCRGGRRHCVGKHCLRKHRLGTHRLSIFGTEPCEASVSGLRRPEHGASSSAVGSCSADR